MLPIPSLPKCCESLSLVLAVNVLCLAVWDMVRIVQSVEILHCPMHDESSNKGTQKAAANICKNLWQTYVCRVHAQCGACSTSAKYTAFAFAPICYIKNLLKSYARCVGTFFPPSRHRQDAHFFIHIVLDLFTSQWLVGAAILVLKTTRALFATVKVPKCDLSSDRCGVRRRFR